MKHNNTTDCGLKKGEQQVMQVTLKAMRANANMSQAFVADKLGINKATLLKWETNRSAPTVSQFDALCKLYKCNRDDIFLPDKLAKS